MALTWEDTRRWLKGHKKALRYVESFVKLGWPPPSSLNWDGNDAKFFWTEKTGHRGWISTDGTNHITFSEPGQTLEW